jgi:hypothetical protein
MAMSRRARAALVAAALAAGALGLLFVVLTRTTVHVPPDTLQQPSARPLTLPSNQIFCDATRKRYLRELDRLNHCTTDDECRGEARGLFFTDLDWCARYLPGPAPRGEIDALAGQWLEAGCAHDYVECADDPRARCEAGRCVERPPEGIPDAWKRVIVLGYFTFFLPPDFEGSMGLGDDSYTGHWRRPGMLVDMDFSQWPSTLDSSIPPDLWDQKITRRTSINGAPAKLVTARVRRQTDDGLRIGTMSGVYFESLPLRTPNLLSTRALNLIAWCDELAGCEDATTIFQSLIFY